MQRLVKLMAVLLLMSISGVAAQDYELPAIETGIDLDAITSPMDTEKAMLAPDGSAVVFPSRDSLCLYRIESREAQCNLLPEAFASDPVGIAWSRDSAYIAFTEDMPLRNDEPDIWVMAVDSATFTNLTDDGVQRLRANMDTVVPVDFMPLWGPDGVLYFLRVMSDQDLREDSATLYRVDPTGGEPEMITPLPGVPIASVYESNRALGLKGPAVMSPDGRMLAVSVVKRTAIEDPTNGIWLFDLTGEREPRQLLAMADLRGLGMPPYNAENSDLQPIGLDWALDGAALVFMAHDFQTSFDPPHQMTYFLDVATGAVTPLVDFSELDITPRDFFFMFGLIDPESDLASDTPRAAAVAPDGRSVYILHQTYVLGLSIATLPPVRCPRCSSARRPRSIRACPF